MVTSSSRYPGDSSTWNHPWVAHASDKVDVGQVQSSGWVRYLNKKTKRAEEYHHKLNITDYGHPTKSDEREASRGKGQLALPLHICI